MHCADLLVYIAVTINDFTVLRARIFKSDNWKFWSRLLVGSNCTVLRKTLFDAARSILEKSTEVLIVCTLKGDYVVLTKNLLFWLHE